MKVIVLGDSGYIGRHLVPALRSVGHEVVVFPGRHAVTGDRIDISDRRTLEAVDWDVDRVFLFAGKTGTMASFADFEAFVQGNELGLLNVLESIRQTSHRPRVIFPSSRLVYKGSDRPLPETAELEAKTVYAANKMACEHYLRAYSNAFEIPYTVLRICVPYGNTASEHYSVGTLGNFIKQAGDKGSIRLYGGGGLRRTFTHVDDICRAAVLGAALDSFENETFNVPGEDLSLREAAELVAARMGASVESADWPALDLRIESGSTVFDGSKLLARLPDVLTRRMAEWTEGINRG